LGIPHFVDNRIRLNLSTQRVKARSVSVPVAVCQYLKHYDVLLHSVTKELTQVSAWSRHGKMEIGARLADDLRANLDQTSAASVVSIAPGISCGSGRIGSSGLAGDASSVRASTPAANARAISKSALAQLQFRRGRLAALSGLDLEFDRLALA
jgi:hypothetical protein